MGWRIGRGLASGPIVCLGRRINATPPHPIGIGSVAEIRRQICLSQPEIGVVIATHETEGASVGSAAGLLLTLSSRAAVA